MVLPPLQSPDPEERCPCTRQPLGLSFKLKLSITSCGQDAERYVQTKEPT
ncbi:hypothetical protein CBM2605_A260061 [Cupriavidus neocaledonicus]|uniref:Transposase n=1 Tax=Cupriavidus neocaledonicus TaxID=1040979 RepID=A0ABY1V1Q5_9BURK|nr:hypothetical protein CBM2605_A260061 [Cupriavidus neocaledonicus]